MKWLTRGCWLLAWGVWLALGLGLHQQLPREHGPFIRRLWSGDGFTPIGFVENTNELVVMTPSTALFPKLDARVVNAETGEVRGDRSLPISSNDRGGDGGPPLNPSSLKFGYLIGAKTVEVNDVSARYEGLHALDLLTGEWRELSKFPGRKISPHAEKPWVAFTEGASQSHIKVMDYRTGQTMFSHDLPTGRQLFHHLAFVPGHDALILPLQGRLKSGRIGNVFEVWNLAKPAVLEHAVGDVGDFRTPVVWSSNGRMRYEGTLRKVDGEMKHFDVYDFNEKRFLTSSPPSEQPKANDGKFTYKVSMEFSPSISPSGRAVLRFGRETDELDASGNAFTPITLYEVGAGRILWRTNPFETVTESHGEDGFHVEEKWHELWGKWFPNLKFETIACRSLEDGSLIHRTAAGTRIEPRLCNASRTLVVLADGAVLRLPLRVNWPVLALCQTILALPLILLWTLLRWRRRRKLLT